MDPRQVGEAEITSALQILASQLGRTPSVRELAAHLELPGFYITARFRYSELCERAGLRPNRFRRPKDPERDAQRRAEVVAEIKRLATALDRAPSTTEFMKEGQISICHVREQFGDYRAAVEAAGLAYYNKNPRIADGDEERDRDYIGSWIRDWVSRHQAPPTKVDFEQNATISYDRVRRWFGGWGRALETAGVGPRNIRHLPDEELLADWGAVARLMGGLPTEDQYTRHGHFGYGGLKKRFGGWGLVPGRFAAWADEREEWADVVGMTKGMGSDMSALGPARGIPPHDQVQFELARLGRHYGCQVWVATGDRGKRWGGERLDHEAEEALPDFHVGQEAQRTLENVDVVWFRQGNQLVAAFEIEHTTSIYSGLLRLNDLREAVPHLRFALYVVAPRKRVEEVRRQLKRPTFRQLGLFDTCRYLVTEDLLANMDNMLRLTHDPQGLVGIAHAANDRAE